MRKKIFLFTILFILLCPLLVDAEGLSCNYYYYYNGNALNDSATDAEYYANCTFKISKGSATSGSCTMNYYLKGKEKTKKVSIQNMSSTGNNLFVYTSDGKSAKEVIGSTGTCPDYVVARYDASTNWLGWNTSTITLYAAQDETRAKAMKQNWVDVGVNDARILMNTELSYSDDVTEKAYQQIEDWIDVLEQTTTTTFDFSECEDSTKVITRYTQCKTIIKNMETGITTVEKEFLDYVKNGKVDENDSRVKELTQLIEDYKKKINNVNNVMENLDCDTKLQLGLVTTCSTTDSNQNSDSDTTTTTSGTRGCDILGGVNSRTVGLLSDVVKIVRLGVPILIIILGITDFMKILFSGEDKVFKDAFSKFAKRLGIGVIIIFIPYLLQAVIKLTGIETQYGIDNFFCGIVDATSSSSSSSKKTTSKSCTDYSAKDCPTTAENGDSCKVRYENWDTQKENGYCSVSSN